MATNEDIIKKRFGLLAEEIRYATTKEIAISKILEMLKEARSEGYKEGQQAERQRCIEILKNEKTIKEDEDYKTDYQRHRDLAIDRAIAKLSEFDD